VMASPPCRRRQLTGNPSCVRVAVAGQSARKSGLRANANTTRSPGARVRSSARSPREAQTATLPVHSGSVFFREIRVNSGR
jgi:hypothetical protein